MQPRKIAFANQKGGVGKTSTTLGIASAAAKLGVNVLVVDADPQGNSTKGLSVDITDDQLTTFDLMNSSIIGRAAEAIVATEWNHVDLIPADSQLANIESDGSNDLIFRMEMAFEGVDLSSYGLVLIDCPPSLGKILFSVLVAADGVVAVTEPTIDSVDGVINLAETIGHVRRRPNKDLTFDKIVISRKRGTGEHTYRENELRTEFGELVAKTVIPDLATRQDAHSSRTPIHEYKGGTSIRLQVAYDDLLSEIREVSA
ncbi:ParA family protein [Gordonia sp. (in: high G+C Gram-positive bacteria)]|uniref:ParA family protein n=1 Tax=Gordonia sp. (in: high G+C Gram-positive bacteria) TaxID=84139 RepID=UPI003C719B5F